MNDVHIRSESRAGTASGSRFRTATPRYCSSSQTSIASVVRTSGTAVAIGRTYRRGETVKRRKPLMKLAQIVFSQKLFVPCCGRARTARYALILADFGDATEGPRLLAARTTQVYVLPERIASRPLPATVIGLLCPVAVGLRRGLPTGVHEAVYFVMGAPLLFGALKDTTSVPLAGPFFTVGFAGCDGVPITIAAVSADADPLPTTFVATTLKRYALPFARPASVSVVAGDVNTCGVAWDWNRYPV